MSLKLTLISTGLVLAGMSGGVAFVNSDLQGFYLTEQAKLFAELKEESGLEITSEIISKGLFYPEIEELITMRNPATNESIVVRHTIKTPLISTVFTGNASIVKSEGVTGLTMSGTEKDKHTWSYDYLSKELSINSEINDLGMNYPSVNVQIKSLKLALKMSMDDKSGKSSSSLSIKGLSVTNPAEFGSISIEEITSTNAISNLQDVLSPDFVGEASATNLSISGILFTGSGLSHKMDKINIESYLRASNNYYSQALEASVTSSNFTLGPVLHIPSYINEISLSVKLSKLSKPLSDDLIAYMNDDEDESKSISELEAEAIKKAERILASGFFVTATANIGKEVGFTGYYELIKSDNFKFDSDFILKNSKAYADLFITNRIISDTPALAGMESLKNDGMLVENTKEKSQHQ